MGTRTCGTCSGSGSVERRGKTSTCQTCGGSGTVQSGSKEDRRDLGRKPPKRK